jgi:hypothetical protein
MLVPMTCLFLAVGLKDWWMKPRGAYVAAAIAVFSLAELVPYYGHTLAFSNSFLLPKKDAYRVLADSNLYWNEYHAQIPGLLLERGVQASINPVHVLPGKNAIDSFELSGVLWIPRRQHQWARDRLETSGHVKHVIFLYDVSERDFSRFLDENRRYPAPRLATDCEGSSGTSVPIAARGEGWMLLCANARELTDVSLSVRSGTVSAGHVNGEGRCIDDTVRKQQEIWFRLEPGRHVLCLSTDGGLEGSWDVRRGAASFQRAKIGTNFNAR